MIAWVYAVDIFQLWESVDTLWYYHSACMLSSTLTSWIP